MGAKPRTQGGKGQRSTKRTRSARASASLPPDIYQTLQDIARQKKVSFAWVIRDAAEKYIADQWPLLERR
jgi:predicted DNA-binding ribbon-helix-helix protein